jgi:hypothetical protein
MYLSRNDLDRYLAEFPDVYNKLQVGATVKERQRLKRYPWMELDEQIVFSQRRHWFALATRMAVPVVMLFVGLIFLALPTQGTHLLLNLLGFPLAIGGALWGAWVLLDWSNDFYVLTTKRILLIEKIIFVQSSREEVPLDKVQNVNLFQDAIGNLFGYGALLIETAASFGGARIRFNYIGHPADRQSKIFEAMSSVRASRRHETQRTIRDRLAARMGGGNQPYVPGVATAPFVQASAPASGSVWRRRLERVQGLYPFWVERKGADEVTWRKHWIRLLARVWIPSLVGLLLLALLIGAAAAGALSAPVLFLGGLLLLMTAGWWWWGFANWGNDLYTVTNDRLIDIEKTPLGLRTERKETMFDRIQNVSFLIPNPLATILNYGSVIIHTAGAQGALTFDYVHDPSRVQAEIFRRLTAYNERQRRRDLEERWADMPEWFASYSEISRSSQP